MKALIIIAHGSRKELSNNEFISLVDEFREKNTSFFQVKAAFLEIAKPSISEVVKSVANDDIKEIVIYPYFLNQGKHVLVDIPDEINEEQKKYPNIKFKVLSHFGSSSRILDIIENDVNL